MMNLKLAKAFFLHSEDGAVTVDWIVLAGFVVGVAIALTYSFGTATADHGEAIDAVISTRGIVSY